MLTEIRELWRFRELLWAMVERELRIRYKNSVLGFFWSLLNPLVTVVVMTFVFQVFLRNSTPNYSAYVLAAYIPFLFFQFALLDSAQSVLSSLPVVRKVYFPREILPLASVISNFIHFLLAMSIFFVYLFILFAATGFENSPFGVRMLFLPVVLIVQFMLATGMALAISALNVFYEDVKYIVSVSLYLLFFLTPIMYFSETVYAAVRQRYPDHWELIYTLYHANPIAMLAVAYRKTLLPPQEINITGNEFMAPLRFDWTMFGVCVGVSLAVLVGGYALFNRLKWRFVERP